MSLDLTVESLTDRLDGYGIVAMPPETMVELDVEAGDFVSFDAEAGQATAAVQPATDDTSDEYVAIGRSLRETLSVNDEDMVTVSALSVDTAHRMEVSLVDVAPEDVDISQLRTRLQYRIVSPGATVTVPLDGNVHDSVTVRVESITPSRTVGTKGYTTIDIQGVPATASSAPDREPRAAETISLSYSDIGGLSEVIRDVREVVELPLAEPEVFDRFGIDPPSGVLLHGPPGTGKTLLARVVASEADAHFESISAGEVFSKWLGESESNLRDVFDRARRNAPSIIYIDEIDAIASDRGAHEGPGTRVVNELLTQMDGLADDDGVVVLASTNRLDDLDPGVRRPGRFDREIEVAEPDAAGRQRILQIHTRGVPLGDDVDIEQYADRTPGYTGADLEQVVQEAVLAALRRRRGQSGDGVDTTALVDASTLNNAVVKSADFDVAIAEVEASGLRAHRMRQPDVCWDDIGGLDDQIQTLRELIAWPQDHPALYDDLQLAPASGILLHGPPGTGKTLLAKALASETDAAFLSVAGPELLEGTAGETEAAIRDLFATARTHAPAIVFFDEIDALTASRATSAGATGHDSVVAQLLTELDGVTANSGVTVVGATNQPGRIDDAILRSGRFDALLEIGLPDTDAREEILAIHTAGRPLAPSVGLERLAADTEGFSAATLAALCRRASRNCARRGVEVGTATPQISHADFQQALSAVVEEREGLADGDQRVSNARGFA